MATTENITSENMSDVNEVVPVKFIHLRAHSAYSLLEGALKPAVLANAALRFETPAIGVTDRNNLFGALEVSEKLSDIGVQPIIGVTLSLRGLELPGRDRHDLPSIALFAQNETGYLNLLSIVSRAHLEGDGIEPPGVTLEDVSKAGAGIICLTGGREGPIDKYLGAQNKIEAEKILHRLCDIFPNNLYIELQRYGLQDDEEIEAGLIDFAYAHDIPLVATNQSFFESEEDFEAHDALICIAEGTYVRETERRQLTPNHRLKTPQEMVSLFADLPEAIENTVEIARRCAFRPQKHAPILPDFVAGDGGQGEADELARQARAGLEKRLTDTPPATDRETYFNRLDYELEVINGMGFPGYFLIVADFIQWSKQNGISVGPGRGSGAGSVVAWALTITDLDPLRFGLLFERFLNPERVSMPDFDIDFCQTRRDEVIRYVQQKYGVDQVAQIITFGKLQARAVLRDVGRVLQIPYGQVDRLCKMVPNNPAAPVTLQEAIDSEQRLQEERDNDPAVAQLIEISLKLEGLYRHASTHAAGVVIGDRPLEKLVPLYRDPKSDMPVTQFNMKWVESAGLVKFDFLGLKTLTVLERAVELLAKTGIEIDLSKLALDDEKTFTMLGNGDTVGVFQLESAGMRDVLRKMQPDCFEDIIALVALYRPGPMDNIPRYIACKKGEEEPDYMHDMLKPVLEETYGVPIYQEQVMQIAQVMSGFSLGEADLLRRAMGKKIKEEMQAQKSRFLEGATENGVDQKNASAVFDQVDRFAGYGFNKSHAAAYALVAYQTAFIKANYPVAFYAASMSLDYENTDKLQIFVQDALAHDIKVSAPDINRSDVMFETGEQEIIYALSAIKNVGRQSMIDLVAERTQNGPYKDIFDFARRVGAVGINSKLLENLISSGAFDCLETDRARLFESVKMLLSEASIAQNERKEGQSNLFGEEEISESRTLQEVAPWSPVERLTREFDAIGFYLSGHPLDDYRTVLRRMNVLGFEDLAKSVENNVLLAGTIAKMDERKSKQGNPFAYLGLSDPTGQFEAIVFSEVLNNKREILSVGQSVIISAKVSREDDTIRLQAENIRSLDEVVASGNDASLRIFVENKTALPYIRKQLDEGCSKGDTDIKLSTAKGGIVTLIMQNERHEVELRLPGKYQINPGISGAIKALNGVLHVEDI